MSPYQFQVQRPRRHQPQSGFTLIELLVVIIILGILSAVVVLAVRGTNDKGKGAALATDARTIRTAQEAYCARAGHYATMDQLTGAARANDQVNTYKLLSEASEHHKVAFKPSPGGGSCNGTGFEIECKNDRPMPNCDIATPAPEPEAWEWKAATDLPTPGRGWARTLPSGKVLYLSGVSLLFDPAAAEGKGSWTPTAPLPPGSMATKPLLIEGTAEECGLNCGNVLVQMINFQTLSDAWLLYNPTLNAWLPAGVPSIPRPYGTASVQLRGSQCGLHCGKVLITGGGTYELGDDDRTAELFDPKAPAAASWSKTGLMVSSGIGTLAMTALANGGAMAFGASDAGTGRPQIFEPGPDTGNGVGTWSYANTDGDGYSGRQWTTNHVITTLSDGRVLFAGGNEGSVPSLAELYDPDEKKWTRTGACACRNVGFARPGPFGLLSNGKVVALDWVGGDQTLAYATQAHLFDPSTGTWSTTTPYGVARKDAANAVLPDGRILMIGGGVPPSGGSTASVEIYGPPMVSPSELTPPPRGRLAAG